MQLGCCLIPVQVTEQQVRFCKSSVKFCVLKEFQARHQLPSKINAALSSSSTEIFNFTISIAAIKLITQFKRSKSRREIPKGKNL